TNALARLLRDDGGVVYLNGTEVFRSNMPTGTIAYATLASSSALPQDETTNFYVKFIDPTVMRAGSNVVAVEIHQNAVTSSDISFDFALLGNFTIRPPLVAITNIAQNSFFKVVTNVAVAAAASAADLGV